MTTVFPSETVRMLVRRAEQVLERHVTASADDRCLSCGAVGPCRRQRAALVILHRYGRLPARRPGATRPDQVYDTEWAALRAAESASESATLSR